MAKSTRQAYRVRVGEREHEVEIIDEGSGRPEVIVDGHRYEVAEAGGHGLRVAPAPSSDEATPRVQTEVTLAGSPRPAEAWLVGARVQVEVKTEAEAKLAAALGKSGGAAGSGSLTAPMPGRVVKVLVSEGQSVEQGAPLVIVEAMKMENELHAPATGVVESIAVGEGETVDAGQILCEVTAPSTKAD